MSWLWSFLKSLFTKKVVAPPSLVTVTPTPPPPVSVPTKSGLQAALSWELPCDDGQVGQKAHPERRAWSEALFKEIEKEFLIIYNAKDIKTVIPELTSLTKDQIITKLCELMSAVAKYECSWNPGDESKDTNGSSSADKLATGLYQLNVEDQDYWKTGTNFTHEELKNPLNNIKAGVGIIASLVVKDKQITYIKGQTGKKGPFFETLTFGAKYEHVQIILKMVADLKFNL